MARNHIFFSYSFRDEEKVIKVRDLLESIVDEEGNQKYSVFMASDPIKGNTSGMSWNARERREMLNSFLVLFFLSEHSIVSNGASQELEFYFNTMRKAGDEKFLYVSLNGKSMLESILDFMRNDDNYLDGKIETIINRYDSMLDEPDFRDNHLYIKYDDEHFEKRLELSVLELYNLYNKIHKKENKYKNFINKLETIQNETKEEENKAQKQISKVEKKEVKTTIKKEKKKENKVIDSSLADIFKKVQDTDEVIANKRAIKECFALYNIKGEIINYYVGPTITLYEIKLDPNEKLNKFLKMKDDLTLMIGDKIRIVAPLVGRNTCGIEIPNKQKRLLKFGELLTDEFLNKGNTFTCVMGKNVFNEIKEYDVSQMPHCLISGGAGSGAVNILNTIIVSLLMKYSPEELKLVLADPLQVEFNCYEKVPHLLYPLIKDASVGTPLFKEIYEEIVNRFSLLEQNNVRNIYQYNEKRTKKMPYILIVINEYADFVLFNKDIESYIARIIQVGRAVGVHFVLYTQRPTVDILTGVLKSNFATRITGRVSSYIDSRTIIDEGGAELLLGKGDTIVKFGSISERIQSAFITEEELTNFCEAIVKKYGESDKRKLPMEQETQKEKIDVKILKAIELLYLDNSLSLLKLSKELKSSYGRCVDILEKLKTLGIVKAQGSIAIPLVSKDEALRLIISKASDFLAKTR